MPCEVAEPVDDRAQAGGPRPPEDGHPGQAPHGVQRDRQGERVDEVQPGVAEDGDEGAAHQRPGDRAGRHHRHVQGIRGGQQLGGQAALGYLLLQKLNDVRGNAP